MDGPLPDELRVHVCGGQTDVDAWVSPLVVRPSKLPSFLLSSLPISAVAVGRTRNVVGGRGMDNILDWLKRSITKLAPKSIGFLSPLGIPGFHEATDVEGRKNEK